MDSIKSCKITVGVSDKNHVDLSFLPVKMKDKPNYRVWSVSTWMQKQSDKKTLNINRSSPHINEKY